MDLSHLTAPDTPLAIIGLGYVGLPLAVEFGKHRPVIGFDIKPERIAELQAGRDSTRETTPAEPAAARRPSPAAPARKSPPSSTPSTARSSPPAPTAPAASASPKRPRSSRTPSATSTSP